MTHTSPGLRRRSGFSRCLPSLLLVLGSREFDQRRNIPDVPSTRRIANESAAPAGADMETHRQQQ
jgi:hypothetical protein